MTDSEKDKKDTKDLPYYIRYYIQEIFEAFVAIIVIRTAMDKPIDILKVLFESSIIGMLTFALEQYNSDYKASIASGISFTVGSQLMARHL